MLRHLPLTLFLPAVLAAAGCESPARDSKTTDPTAARGGEGEWSFELLPTYTGVKAVLAADPEAARAEMEANRAVKEKLQKKLDVALEANRLVNVIEHLRKETGVNFFMNWASLEAAGVEADIPATFTLNGATAELALKLVLRQVAASADLEPIGYEIREGVVFIDTVRALNRLAETRIYDVRDLLSPVGRVTRFGVTPSRDVTIHLHLPPRLNDQAFFLFADDGQTEPTVEERMENLAQLIQDQVGSQADWAAYGGDVSSLREMDGDIVVSTTRRGHEQLALLLAALRQSRVRAAARIDDHFKRTAKQADAKDLMDLLYRLEQKFDGEESDDAPQPEAVQPREPS